MSFCRHERPKVANVANVVATGKKISPVISAISEYVANVADVAKV